MRFWRFKYSLIYILLALNLSLILYYIKKLQLDADDLSKLDLTELDTNKNHSNPHNFKMILNPGDSFCGSDKSKKLTLIAIVLVTPESFKQRDKIRQTWGRHKFNDKFKLVFALGLSKNIKINDKIKKEFEIYKDIVQENFLDSYQNLTKKAIMCFKWISNFCSNSYFTLRINDDVVVNTYKLMNYLDDLIKNNKNTYLNNKMIGFGYFNTSPIRAPESKFYIPYDLFNQTYYDEYCEGSAYLITNDLNKKFYEYSLNFNYPPFSTWLEDVYMGMIAKRLNTSIIDISKAFQPKNQYADFNLEYKLTLIDSDTMFVYDLNMTSVWNKFKKKFY